MAVSSFGRPGQRVTTDDAMALLRTALVAVVAAGADFLPPPPEEIAPHSRMQTRNRPWHNSVPPAGPLRMPQQAAGSTSKETTGLDRTNGRLSTK